MPESFADDDVGRFDDRRHGVTDLDVEIIDRFMVIEEVISRPGLISILIWAVVTPLVTATTTPRSHCGRSASSFHPVFGPGSMITRLGVARHKNEVTDDLAENSIENLLEK